MAKAKHRIADQAAIRGLFDSTNAILDPRPLIVYTMRRCGCTYQEIAEVFGVKRQMIELIIKNVERDINADQSRRTEDQKKVGLAEKGGPKTSK